MAWDLPNQGNRYQCRCVFQRHDTVRHIARKVEQVPSAKNMTLAFSRDINAAFDAEHGNFAWHLVWRQRLAGSEDKANHLEVLRLEQRDNLLAWQPTAKRPNVDRFTGACVRYGHDLEYARTPISTPIDLSCMTRRAGAWELAPL